MSKKKASSSRAPSIDKTDTLDIVSAQNPLSLPSILLRKYIAKTHTTIDNIPSRYTSYFFRKDIITEFTTDFINSIPRGANNPFSTFKFYNKDDIINNLTYNGSPESRQISTVDTGLKTNLKSALDSLTNVCSKIGEVYIKRAFENTIIIPEDISSSKFDILLLSTDIIEDITKDFDARISGIRAFIIVELGECEKFPKAFSINLICAKAPGTGSLLMGAYLYTILSHPIDPAPVTGPIDLSTMGINGEGFLNIVTIPSPDGSDIYSSTFVITEPLIPVQDIAVLELANSYANTGGLCMYEKFGFQYDSTMFSDSTVNCFNDRNNLPMKIDFTNDPILNRLPIRGKKKLILDITTGIVKNVFTKSPICNLRDQSQELLGYLKFYYLYKSSGINMRNFTLSNPLINKELTKLVKRNPNIIPDLINYLETKANSPTSIDTSMEGIINNLFTLLPPPPPPPPTPTTAPTSATAPTPTAPTSATPAPAPAPTLRRSTRGRP